MKITIVTILFLFSWPETSFSQVAVIAHKSVPMDTIRKSELLDFYTSDIKKWNDEEPVIVFDFKPKGELKDIFYKYLGKSTSRMKSIWMKNLLSGEGNPPEALESENKMLEKVSTTPGSIGFISQSNVSDNVKTLKVIELQ